MIHENLAAGRWQNMTLAEQLGNAGSEFERAWTWKQQKAQDKFESALARFLELMDMTITDPRWQGVRNKELSLAKEISIQALYSGEADVIEDLQKYFLQFAILARAI